MPRDTFALRTRCVCVLVLIASAITVRSASASGNSPEPIYCGLVIVDGDILTRPYIVAVDDTRLTVNGQPVGQIATTVPSGFPFEDHPANAAVAKVERLLLQDGFLIRHHDTTLLLPGTSASDGGSLMLDVVENLSSRRSPAEILQSLAYYDAPAVRHMTTRRWMELIRLFQTNTTLRKQVMDFFGVEIIDGLDEVALNEEIDADSAELMLEPSAEPADISGSVQYGINLFGMLSGVIALGSLLSFRPNMERRWRDQDMSATGLKLVSRCGGLIVLLGLFDLVCTLMAFHTGMFRELNPVASQLSSSPLMIIAFKVVAITTGVGLLWRLRAYAGAQTAAWWMCLICTLVVFRWLTFHSMFIA